jgi:hypothetical protein
MRVRITADQAGFTLNGQVAESLHGSGDEDVDFGGHQLNPGTRYPDFIIPLPKALPAGEVRLAAESLYTNGGTIDLWNCATRVYVSAFKAQTHRSYKRTRHPHVVASPRHYSFFYAVLTFFHLTVKTRP